ncbi:MAG: DUF192 domain-containing protein [Bacteroidetes bacterium]|nr:DUF192 domain-containing protein [Bacteroidota bacterium]
MNIRTYHPGTVYRIILLLVCVSMLVSCITNDYENHDFIIDISQTKTIEIQLGEEIYIVEVADTVDLHLKGLRGRKELPDNGGMLFKYDSDRELFFWMRDTNLLLTIAFLLEDGKIVSIQDMFPNSSFSVQSVVPVRYALELPLGAFKKAGVRVGDTIDLFH